jgi:hypothetical protein
VAGGDGRTPFLAAVVAVLCDRTGRLQRDCEMRVAPLPPL